MSGPIDLSAVLTFTLAFALGPGWALAQSSVYPAPFHHRTSTRRHILRPPAEARLARPAYGLATFGSTPFEGPGPREDQNIPAISRNPDDCAKTMCTCIGGGGC